jgi:hypothetical protein
MADIELNWPFDQPKNCAAITLRSIVFAGAPILLVCHDEDDHAWQSLGGEDFDETDAAVVAMEEIVDRDPSVSEVADLPPGRIAWRERVGDAWERQPHAE